MVITQRRLLLPIAAALILAGVHSNFSLLLLLLLLLIVPCPLDVRNVPPFRVTGSAHLMIGPFNVAYDPSPPPIRPGAFDEMRPASHFVAQRAPVQRFRV